MHVATYSQLLRRIVSACALVALLLLASPVSSQAQPEWKTLSGDGFTSRWDYASVAVPSVGAGGSIYTFGGRKYDPTEFKYVVYDVIEAFDVATGKWSTITPVGTPAKRATATASLVNGKIYLIGGVGEASTRISLIEEFDPATGIIREVSQSVPHTEPWNGHTATVVDGKIYLFGGFLDLTRNVQVQIYDPVANTWEAKTPVGTAFTGRTGASSSAIGNEIYILGGIAEQGGGGVDLIQKYYPATNELSTLEERMLLGLWNQSSVALNGQIYIIGGFSDGSANFANADVYSYDPAAGPLAAYSYFSTSGDHKMNGSGSSIAIGGNIYQIGFGTAFAAVPPQVLMLEAASVDGRQDREDISVSFDGSNLHVIAEIAPSLLSLHDVCGREVVRAAGMRDTRLSMENVVEGVYFLRAQYPQHTITHKLIYRR